MESVLVSIVVPVFDDTEALGRLLPTLARAADAEVLVVNGGSPDARLTALTEAGRGVTLLTSPPGRGRQMNAGAAAARGRWLLFLHADTRLPADWLDEIRRADRDASVAGGSFRFHLESTAWQARLIERCVQWRVSWLGLAYGDQALFVRRDAFERLGGYRDWPLMEDVDLIRRLGRVGCLYHSARPATTSARRWERDGWWRRSGQNLLLQAAFFAGASPQWIAERYTRRAAAVRSDALVVMARAPSDPAGKSRLMCQIPRDHVELRRAILLDTLDAAAAVRRAELFVAFEPADALPELKALMSGGTDFFAQRGDTLGERMHHAFVDLFARGYSRVVIIGSDLPTLPPGYIAQAFEGLRDEGHSAAIGPAADAGYYLIGLRAPAPELFMGIPWGTPAVLAATTRAAERIGLIVSRLPEWYDVDQLDDLRRVVHDEPAGTRTRAWINAHAADL